MGILKKLGTHRTWEDWVLLALGVLIFLSPTLAGATYAGLPAANAVIVGLIIVFVAELEIAALARWEEIVNLMCGIWIAVCPVVLGYSHEGQLRFWHFGLGALVVTLMLLELWQDRQKANNAPRD